MTHRLVHIMLTAITVALIAPAAFASADFIDPTLEYATYLGGSGQDNISNVAQDSNGNYVVCGNTTSPSLATPGAAQTTYGGGSDVFVSKISADGTTLLFTTYFGGSSPESCNRLRLDADDNILIAGITQSANMPTPGGFDTTFGGGGFGTDAFVTKFVADGSAIVFSTYLGGMDLDGEEQDDFLFGRETARGLEVDADGNIYVVGNTSAADFPATHQLSGRVCGDDTPFVGSSFVSDQFIMKLSPSGGLIFSTCFGGTARDAGRGVALLSGGEILVIGHTRSTDYPTTAGAVNTGSSGGIEYNPVVTVLNSDATAILRAARVGGSADDWFQNVQIDAAGRPVLIGSTSSRDFPVTVGAFQTDFGPPPDPNGFVNLFNGMLMRLSGDLSTIEFATYFGGNGQESPFGLALDELDRMVFLTQTDSTDLPVAQPLQATKAGDVAIPRLQTATAGAQAIASGRDFAFPDGTFVVVARNGLNDLYRVPAAADPFFVGPLASEAFDSRAIGAFDVNYDGVTDIVVGNYDGPNHLYINDPAFGLLPAVEFGDPDGRTVGISVGAGDGVTAQIVEANEGQQNNYYNYSAGALSAPIPFGATDSASVDLGPKTGANFQLRPFVEAVAPDQVIIHEINSSGVSSTSRTFPGVDIGGIDTLDLDMDGLADLFLADRNGGVVVVLNDLVSGPAVTLDTGGAASEAVAAAFSFGIASAHPDGLRYFKFDATNGFAAAQFLPSATALSTVAYTSSNGSYFAAGGPTAPDRFSSVGTTDLYVGVMSPNGDALEFGTYLGGAGAELGSWGLALDGAGQVIIGGASEALDFPTVLPLQTANAGDSDAVLAVIRLQTDGDFDGVEDSLDNCRLIANADQRDTDGDGYGNLCDADFNNDCIVNITDLGLLRAGFFGTDADLDLDGDGNVNVIDLGLLRLRFFEPPGPSGPGGVCDS